MKSKRIAIIFTILIIISMFPTVVLADTFAQGDGTESNPYGISTPEQLNAVRDYPDAHFIMLNDIDMSAATSEGGAYWNDGAGWEPIGDDTTQFTGLFDGGGYAIKGIYQYSESTSTCGGLFGYLENTTICNLGLEGGKYTVMSAVGGIAGRGTDSLISNCYNTNRIIGAAAGGIIGIMGDGIIISSCYNTGGVSSEYRYLGNSGSGHAGGIAGKTSMSSLNMSTTVENCYNAGSVSGGEYGGGILGYMDANAILNNCYNVGSIVGNYAGGIVGRYIAFNRISNCYYLDNIANGVGYGHDETVSVTKAQLALHETFDGFDFGSAWTMEGSAEYLFPELNGAEMVVQPISQEFAGGNGLSYDPYQISTTEQLNNVRNYPDADYILVNDIVFMEADYADNGAFYNNGEGFAPFGSASTPFSGFFDGNGYTINRLYQNISGSYHIYSGLCGYVSFGTIQNLNLDGVNITVNSPGFSSAVGGIAGYMNEGFISDCDVAGIIDGEPYTDVGGIVGHVDAGIIMSCHNEAAIFGSDAGGIVGDLKDAMINDSDNTGVIKGDNDAGGIIGCNSSDGCVNGCSNTGGITGSDQVGGIVGSINNSGVIKYCDNTADIIGEGNYTGGIVGYADLCTIKECYNSGDVDCEGYAGGIAGLAGGTIMRCYNTGEIRDGDCVGGIVGYVHNNTVDIYFNNYIYDCFNTGHLIGKEVFSYTGGIIGLMVSGTVRTSYNTGSMTASDALGGILGRMLNCSIENCYYLDNVPMGVGSGTDTATVVTYEQMKQQGTFSGLDFDDIWEIVEGDRFPVLQEVPFIYATGVSLNDALQINAGSSIELFPVFIPQDASNKHISCESSNTSVVIVDNGVVTGVSEGTATITVTTQDGGFTDTCIVTVQSLAITAPDEALEGRSFTVEFDVEGITDLYSSSIDMVFDPDVVQIDSVTIAGVFGGETVSTLVSDIDNAAGTMSCVWSLTDDAPGVNITTETTLITVECTPVNSEDTTWDIDVTNSPSQALTVGGDNTRILLSDSSAQPISVNEPTHSIALGKGYTDDTGSGKLVRTYQNGDGETTAVVYYRGADDSSARLGAYYYNESGTVYFREEFDADDTIIASIFYQADGVTRHFKNYYDHGLHYFQEEYDTGGVIIASIWYQPDGVSRHFKNYYNNGLLYFQEEYDESSVIIASIWFQPDGVSRRFKNYYSGGVLIFQEEYDETSTIIASIWFQADGVTRYFKNYYSGGMLYFQEETNESGIMIAAIDFWEDGETRKRKVYYRIDDGSLYLIEYYDENGDFVASEWF